MDAGSRPDPSILVALDLDPASSTISSHGGSGFASTFKLSGIRGGKTKNYFIKTGSGTNAEIMFKGEYASLNAIHETIPDFCPKAYAHGPMSSPNRYFLATDFLNLRSSAAKGSGKSLAMKLAELHSTPAPIPDGYNEPVFGFPVLTCCGETVQDNSWKSSWAEFYAENRIKSITRMAIQNHGYGDDLDAMVEKFASTVIPRLVGEETLGKIQPVLIHGDLWSGNHSYGQIEGQTGSEELIYDPSSVYGHSEYELGIMKMFGGFGSNFWKEYHEVVPRAEPVKEYDDRIALYELYHQLNHYAMFGGSYRESAMSIMRRLLRKYGD